VDEGRQGEAWTARHGPSDAPGSKGSQPPLPGAAWPIEVAAVDAFDLDAGPPAPVARPRRRWPLVLTTVVAVLLAAGAVGVAWQQRQVAAAWQERAAAMELARDDARGRTEALQRQLDEVGEVLAVSEGDVARLEDRIRELADEKAQAEDTATTVQVERDVFVELSTATASAVEALDGCVTDLFGLLDDSVRAFNDAAAGVTVDVTPLNAAKDVTTRRCNDARAAAASAGAAADRLLR
jgi:hypothetical protein